MDGKKLSTITRCFFEDLSADVVSLPTDIEDIIFTTCHKRGFGRLSESEMSLVKEYIFSVLDHLAELTSRTPHIESKYLH